MQFLDIWEPLKEILPAGEPRVELETFGDVADIPLSRLKEQLESVADNGLDQPLVRQRKVAKTLAGITGLVLILVGISVIIIIKYRGLFKWVWAVWRNRNDGNELKPMMSPARVEEPPRRRNSFSAYMPKAVANTPTEDVG